MNKLAIAFNIILVLAALGIYTLIQYEISTRQEIDNLIAKAKRQVPRDCASSFQLSTSMDTLPLIVKRYLSSSLPSSPSILSKFACSSLVRVIHDSDFKLTRDAAWMKLPATEYIGIHSHEFLYLARANYAPLTFVEIKESYMNYTGSGYAAFWKVLSVRNVKNQENFGKNGLLRFLLNTFYFPFIFTDKKLFTNWTMLNETSVTVTISEKVSAQATIHFVEDSQGNVRVAKVESSDFKDESLETKDWVIYMDKIQKVPFESEFVSVIHRGRASFRFPQENGFEYAYLHINNVTLQFE